MRKDETFYTDCWLEMRRFLSFLVREKFPDYIFAESLLFVMSFIERDFDKR